MGRSERQKEIQRRRHRRAKINHFKQKMETATVSERGAIIEKIRQLTPGSEEIIERFEPKEH